MAFPENLGRRNVDERSPKKISRETIRPEFVEIWDGLTTTPVDDPAITLVFGENDYSNKQHQWFASLLDEDKVVSGPGGTAGLSGKNFGLKL